MLHRISRNHLSLSSRLSARAVFSIQAHQSRPRRHSSAMTSNIPNDAWDSHIHITDPINFPISSTATYTPHTALLPSALTNAAHLNLPNLVFVQPSTYGTDNTCLLHALKTIGPSKARGVVVIDPAKTTHETLYAWHDLGVRGLRLNLKSVGRKLSKDDLIRLIAEHAEPVRMMKTWALQLYIDLSDIEHIAPLLPSLNIKVVFDHYGSPPTLDSTSLSQLPGWHSLLEMLQSPFAYVKISAPYRLSKDPEFKDLEFVTKELLRVRDGKGVVFASDWPHTRFEGVDVGPFVEMCGEWCGGDQGLRERLFRGNAKVLWDVE
ncbi:hypothetical protein N7G274_003733 [Stereocaulon virgatum]|uniref:Amidohydrolase-related domain-containing protein n=1 Tax=Stereocaulon virgatum TaxID=373712 RepID=A0ABR4AFR1_9LECA